MGKRVTFAGYIRQRGNSDSKTPASPGVTMNYLRCQVTPTQAMGSMTPKRILPKGAIPLHLITLGGATGGTNPTIDVQLAGGAAAGLANELDADTLSTALVTSGASLGAALTADTEVQAGVGASAATGGTTTFLIGYLMQDDLKLND